MNYDIEAGVTATSCVFEVRTFLDDNFGIKYESMTMHWKEDQFEVV